MPASFRMRLSRPGPTSFLVCIAMDDSLGRGIPELAMTALPRSELFEAMLLQQANELGPGHISIFKPNVGFRQVFWRSRCADPHGDAVPVRRTKHQGHHRDRSRRADLADDPIAGPRLTSASDGTEHKPHRGSSIVGGCWVLKFEQRRSHRGGHFDGHEAIGREQVVLAALVDDSNIAVTFGLIVRQDGVDLVAFQ